MAGNCKWLAFPPLPAGGNPPAAPALGLGTWLALIFVGYRAIYIRMHKTTIYLHEDTYRRISRLAQARGTTQAALIREALAAYGAGGPKKPTSIGMGKSKSGDLSERTEELLDGFGEDP